MDAKLTLACLLTMAASAVALAADPIRDPFATQSEHPNRPTVSPLRSPQSVRESTDTAPQLELRAVLWGDKPLANISGMIVAPGDRVHDFVVTELTRGSAVLRYGSQIITLVLAEDN